MAKFFVTGIITKPIEVKEFKNGAKCKTIWLEERTEGSHPATYTHLIEFNGRAASEVPEDVDLLGARACIMGKITAVLPEGQRFPFENLKGDKFVLLSLSGFEEKEKEEVSDSVESQVFDEDSFPF